MSHSTIARGIVLDIEWDYTMARFPHFAVNNTKVLINMHDNVARKFRLRQETLCNNGRKEAWFRNFRLPMTSLFMVRNTLQVWVLVFLVRMSETL